MTLMPRSTVFALSFSVASFLFASHASALEIAGADVKPRASVTGTYDDNVTFLSDNEVDDFITRVSAGLEAKAEGKTRTLNLVGNLNHEFFVDNSDFDNTSGDLSADFRQELSEYDRIRLRDFFIHADEARTFEEAFNRTRGRYSYFRNRFQADYMHDFTSKFSVAGRYMNEISEYERGDVRDSMLNAAGVEASYQTSSSLRFFGAYDFEIRDFEGGRDAHTNTLSGGAVYYFTKQVYLEGRAGVDFIESFNGENFEEPLLRLRLTDELNETTSVDVAFEMENSPTSYTEDIFDYWQVSASLRRQMSQRLFGYVSAFYGDGEYQSLLREDTLWGANASLSYDLTKNLKGNLRYTFTDVESSLASQEYTKNTVMLGLVLQF